MQVFSITRSLFTYEQFSNITIPDRSQRCALKKKNIFMESICCIFFCSAIVCSVMRSCSKFVFQLCSVRQYRKLQKVFVQIKKGIIIKLWYRKFQNKTFELRHSLSCRFQVVVLWLLLSEERDKGFSETSWICSITSVLP